MTKLMEWSEDFSVKIPSIDRQHKKLISLINEIHDLILRKEFQKQMGPVIDELKRYTEYHFKYEESIFSENSYPEKDFHEQQHLKFFTIISELKQRADNNEIVMGSEILIILKDWLLLHIKIEDQAYSEFLVGCGVK